MFRNFENHGMEILDAFFLTTVSSTLSSRKYEQIIIVLFVDVGTYITILLKWLVQGRVGIQSGSPFLPTLHMRFEKILPKIEGCVVPDNTVPSFHHAWQ